MSSDEDGSESVGGRRICFECIGERYLSGEVKRDGLEAECSYCCETRGTIGIESLADRIETAFEEHFERTPTDPSGFESALHFDKECEYEWSREGSPVVDAIRDAAGIPEAAAVEVQELLDSRHYDRDLAQMAEEWEFSSDACYEEKGVDTAAWQEAWVEFERSLKTQARFFNHHASLHLKSIFDGIEHLKTTSDRPVIVRAGPGEKIDHMYRARVFQSQENLKGALCSPDLRVGPPASKQATAGRMNALGVSVFYGASQESTAIAEVRPPVGSSVVTARFDLVRPLRLLDFISIEKVVAEGSIFDKSYKGRCERIAFLRTLGSRIARPVMPDDESFDYLPTQAIADYLATDRSLNLDGVVYKSVQYVGGLCVVLFNKAARVEPIELPEGVKVTARCHAMNDDDCELDYYVTVETPASSASTPPAHDVRNRIVESFLAHRDQAYDLRESSLRIDLESLAVHQVDSVAFSCARYPVRRHSFDEGNCEF